MALGSFQNPGNKHTVLYRTFETHCIIISLNIQNNGSGSMLTAASPPPCTARMRDCLLTQEDHQVVVEAPALLSLLSLHPPVLAQYLPAGHQDNLMVTALTLDFAALMAAATLVEKVGRGKWKGPYC